MKWTELVTQTYQENKHKAGYKLKNAMKAAKKVWKTMKKRLIKGGKKELVEGTPVEGGKKELVEGTPVEGGKKELVEGTPVEGGKKELVEEKPVAGGKSHRKTAKNSRSRKSRK